MRYLEEHCLTHVPCANCALRVIDAYLAEHDRLPKKSTPSKKVARGKKTKK